MNKRRNLDRAGLEVYLLNLLLAYRPLLWISGFLLLIFAVAVVSLFPILASLTFCAALLFFLVASSYRAIVYLAKLGAWLGTLEKRNNDR